MRQKRTWDLQKKDTIYTSEVLISKQKQVLMLLILYGRETKMDADGSSKRSRPVRRAVKVVHQFSSLYFFLYSFSFLYGSANCKEGYVLTSFLHFFPLIPSEAQV